MKKSKLISNLENCDQGDLLSILTEVIVSFEGVGPFITARYFGTTNDIRIELEKAKLELFKSMIHPATRSHPAKFRLRMKVANAKQIITSFSLISPPPAFIFELMMYYCVSMNTHLQLMADAKYYAGNAKMDRRILSMLRMYREALKYSQKHAIPPRIVAELVEELEIHITSHARVQKYIEQQRKEIFGEPS